MSPLFCYLCESSVVWFFLENRSLDFTLSSLLDSCMCTHFPPNCCIFADCLLSVCIMSILRLHWLIVASDSTDPTWDNIGIANWSCIELNVAIICPCLTTLKPLLSHFFPRIFSSRSASSNVYDNYGEGVDAESNKAISKSSSATDSRQKSSKPDYGIEIDEHSIDDCSLGSLQPVIIHPGRETMHV